MAPAIALDILACAMVSFDSTWMISATVSVRRCASERAALFGVYCDLVMAAAMRSAASCETWVLPFRYRETVPYDTPARRATSRMVGFFCASSMESMASVFASCCWIFAGCLSLFWSTGVSLERADDFVRVRFARRRVGLPLVDATLFGA